MSAKELFFRRRIIVLPTWRAWLCFLAVGFGLLLGFVRTIHGFLELNAPVAANVLVVEGWVADYTVEAAVAEFKARPYERLVTAGGPMPSGALVSGYATYAALASAAVLKIGFANEKLIEAPTAKTYRHRTFESAKAVRARLREVGIAPRGLNVVSEGSHARRTRAVYRKVFGAEAKIGVIAVAPRDYDAERWWASSEGVKATLMETLAWLYELVFDSGR
ncbi:MAG: YdcF family protein [Verrucomicrobia bacterium]|nr:YdcF family protein [Verrucomicrobiota bacterium]